MNILDAVPITVATVSPMDMGIIFFVILIFFGAKKLPEFARSMGQAVKEFSRAKDDFQREISRAPEPERPRALEHDSYSHESSEIVEPVATVETHPVRPEGTQPYESGSVATVLNPPEVSSRKE